VLAPKNCQQKRFVLPLQNYLVPGWVGRGAGLAAWCWVVQSTCQGLVRSCEPDLSSETDFVWLLIRYTKPCNSWRHVSGLNFSIGSSNVEEFLGYLNSAHRRCHWPSGPIEGNNVFHMSVTLFVHCIVLYPYTTLTVWRIKSSGAFNLTKLY
jgi:hypothetical protein